jgi:hypothetical protein
MRRLVGPAIAAVAFVVYVWSAAAGVEWLDSGELTTAGFTLGVSHPPGQPLFTMLAKVASFVPVGEVAFRVNVLSSVAAAIAVLGAMRLARELIDRPGELATDATAWTCGLYVALSPLVREQALRAEVYAPALALLTWSAAYSIRFVRRDARAGSAALVAALLAALAAALHPMIGAANAQPFALAIHS